MKKFPFLRRPVRLILYAVLLALVTTAALIFAWQYKLDGVVLDHAVDTYAYLGTVVRTDGEIMDSVEDPELIQDENQTPMMGGPAFLEEIPEELVQWLYESEDVARIDNRRTVGGLIGEYQRMKADQTGQAVKAGGSTSSTNWFLEGTVVRATPFLVSDEDEIALDTYQVTVDRMWNAPDHAAKQMIVEVWRMAEEETWEVGQRVFLLGQCVFYNEAVVPEEGSTFVETPAYKQYLLDKYLKGAEMTLYERNSVTLIPDGVDSVEYIQDLLESTGLDKLLEEQLRGLYTVSLIETQDMRMISLFAQGKALTYEGRVLTPSDMGKNVCVIPFGLSQRNRLSVGDTIQLAASDIAYTHNDRESGNPEAGDPNLQYGEYETYEIVGIYSQKGASTRGGNNLYFANTDIFIPAEPDTAAETVRPYAFSFRIPGPDYLDFQAAFQPVLDEHGYSLIIEDTGWDDVKDTFYTMQTRRQLMLLCAAAAFAAAVLVFAVLLNAHCRYEYGLRRLLGASKREAVGIYGATFLFTALPGAAAAVLAAWYIAVHPIKDALATDAMLPLPTDEQCALTLAVWAAAELCAVLVVLLVLSGRNERRGLLRLIRR